MDLPSVATTEGFSMGLQTVCAEPRRILVIDDEPQVLRLFRRILEAAGCMVYTAESGSEGLKVLHDHPVDLLVLDLNMPELDGFEILTLLHSERPNLKVIVTSGFMQGAMLRAARFLGATAVLNKVEAPKRLIETIQTLLG
jgi:CheY-like chemotaxis protein